MLQSPESGRIGCGVGHRSPESRIVPLERNAEGVSQGRPMHVIATLARSLGTLCGATTFLRCATPSAQGHAALSLVPLDSAHPNGRSLVPRGTL